MIWLRSNSFHECYQRRAYQRKVSFYIERSSRRNLSNPQGAIQNDRRNSSSLKVLVSHGNINCFQDNYNHQHVAKNQKSISRLQWKESFKKNC